MALSVKCSKCNGLMEEGVVVDLNYAGVLQSMWVEEHSGNIASGTVVNSKRKVKTMTYRCSTCGFLDSYAK